MNRVVSQHRWPNGDLRRFLVFANIFAGPSACLVLAVLSWQYRPLKEVDYICSSWYCYRLGAVETSLQHNFDIVWPLKQFSITHWMEIEQHLHSFGVGPPDEYCKIVNLVYTLLFILCMLYTSWQFTGLFMYFIIINIISHKSMYYFCSINRFTMVYNTRDKQ